MNRRVEGGGAQKDAAWGIPDEVPVGTTEVKLGKNEPVAEVKLGENKQEGGGFSPGLMEWFDDLGPEDQTQALQDAIEARERRGRESPDLEGFSEGTNTILDKIRKHPLRGAVLSGMIGLVGVGFVEGRDIAQSVADGTGVELVDKAVDVIEGEMTERTVERYDGYFDKAAEDMRGSEKLQAEFEPAEIEAMAESLENFSAQDFFAFAAGRADLDIDEVARSWNLQGIHVYSGADMHPSQLTQMIVDQADMSPDQIMDHLGSLSELAASVRADGGFHLDGHVFVNVSNIAESGVDVSLGLQNVLIHELMHATDKVDEETPGMHGWEEGSVERFANGYVAHTNEISVADADVLSGYSNGPLAGSEMLSAALGSESHLLDRAVITGDWSAVGESVERQFDKSPGWFLAESNQDISGMVSPDAFTSSVLTTDVLSEQSEYEDVQSQITSLQPLVMMSELAIDSPDIINTANEQLSVGAGKISVLNVGSVSGVALVHPWTETGISTGIITVDAGDGHEVPVLLSRHIEDNAGVTIGTPLGEVSIDFDLMDTLGDDDFESLAPGDYSGLLSKLVDVDTDSGEQIN